MNHTVIIGAGLAGLGAALRINKLGLNCIIFEKEIKIGGLCRTENVNGYYFDYTGHLLHFRTEKFKSIVFSLLENNIECRKRNAWIYSKDVYTKYPFQANLYGLPEDVIVECIYEYGKSHFSGDKTGLLTSFRDWIHAHFGSGIARHFMIPYNSKVYCTDPSELSPECGGRFVPRSDLKLLIRGIIKGGDETLGYNSIFYYPQMGGIESLANAMARNMHINTDEKVVKIKLEEKRLTTSKGREFEYQRIISTQPLNELVESCEGEMDMIRNYAADLKYVSVLSINLGVSGNISNKHWIYVPEKKFLFYRIGFTHNFSDNMTPEGHSSLYMEISYDPKRKMDFNKVVEKCIDDLVIMRVIECKEQIEFVKSFVIPYAYVIFDHHREKVLRSITGYLESKGVFTAGRFGGWEYFSMEDSFMDGWKVADYKNVQ